MNMRMRKLVGTVLLMVLIPVYALIAMVVAVTLEVNTTSGWIELAYYAIAGLLWVAPAAVIIKWMSRDDAA